MQNAINFIRSKNWRACVVSTVPAVKWLSKYSWRKDILSDVISGLTVAIMHIPQGMAYALLGNLPPVVGIYMAFFPVLIYFLFGTSKHVSIGKKDVDQVYNWDIKYMILGILLKYINMQQNCKDMMLLYALTLERYCISG